MKRFLQWTRRHARRIAGYTGAQVLFQVLNALAGFVLVRAMSKTEYAWFTIANSLLAAIGVLADSGLGSATTSMGGVLIQDPGRFAGLIRTTRRLRFLFVFAAGAVTLPAGWWVLQRNHAPAAFTAALLAIALVAALFSAETVVLNTVNRLHTRLRFMVQSDFVLGSSRLLLTLVAWWAGLTAVLASLASTISYWLQALILRRQTRDVMAVPDDSGTNWNPAVMRVVRHMFPLCVFSCVQAQLTTWVLSVFASTPDVADVGALSRLSVIFTFISIPMGQLLAPAIARCQEPRRLRKLCIAVIGGYAVIGTVVSVVLASFFSTPLLWILGAKYSHLHVELAWFLGFQAVGLLSTVLWGVALTRSWVRHGWIHIPLTLAAQAAAAFLLDLGQVKNAILFSGIGGITSMFVCGWLIRRGLQEHASHHVSTPAA